MATLLVCLFVGFVVSCKPDNSVTPIIDTPSGEVKVVQVDASSKENWTYFSFSKGEVVDIKPNGKTDVPKGLDWDLAFYMNTIRVNGGLSGEGKGAAVMTNDTLLSVVTQLPADSLFVEDTMGTIISMQGNFDVPFNTEMSKWSPYLFPKMPPYGPAVKNVFVVRCADGINYVKIKFIESSNNKGKYYYPKFQYVYPFK